MKLLSLVVWLIISISFSEPLWGLDEIEEPRKTYGRREDFHSDDYNSDLRWFVDRLNEIIQNFPGDSLSVHFVLADSIGAFSGNRIFVADQDTIYATTARADTVYADSIDVQVASIDTVYVDALIGGQISAADLAGVLAIDKGGTGGSNAENARDFLGLIIDTDVQAYDADLTDLADGSLSGSKVGSGIDASNITAGTLPIARLDADLADLADGSLTGSKVGTGINASRITTGTLPNGRLSTAVARTDGAETFTSTVAGSNPTADNHFVTKIYFEDNDQTSSGGMGTTNANDITAGTLDIAYGGTNASSASAARTNLGLAIGSNVQAYDADLADLADGSLSGSKVGTGISAGNVTTGTLPNARLDADLQDLADGSLTGSKVGTGINAGNITSGTLAIARGGTNASSASAARTNLGLAIGSNVQAYDADLADLADGSLTGSKVGTGINAGNVTTGTLPNARLDADLQDLADRNDQSSYTFGAVTAALFQTNTDDLDAYRAGASDDLTIGHDATSGSVVANNEDNNENLTIANRSHGEPVIITGENASGTERTMLQLDPDGTFDIYAGATLAVDGSASTVDFSGTVSGSNPTADNHFVTKSYFEANAGGSVIFLVDMDVTTGNLAQNPAVTGPGGGYTWMECAVISAEGVSYGAGDRDWFTANAAGAYYDLALECSDGTCGMGAGITEAVLICGN